jgi:drug/metabolite transporter (DMT)-like permease
MKKGLINIMLTALLFTTLEPVSKLIATGVSPFYMTFIRFFIGGLVLLPFSVRKIRAVKMTLNYRDYLKMALLGVLCVCVSMPLLQYGVLRGDSPALIAIIFSSNSIFTVVLAAVILKDRITLRKILAVILCLAGIVVCFDLKSGTNIESALMAVGAAVTFSVYTVVSKKLTVKIPGSVQTGLSFLFGSAVLFLALLITGTGFSIDTNPQSLMILLYLGVGVTGIGYWSYFTAMEKSSAMAASLVFFIKPVLTPFFAFLITGTPLNAKTFAALALVVTGSVLATVRRDKVE